MFARSTWAILGLEKESLNAFKASLENRGAMISVSQAAASAITRHLSCDAVGINPFSAPRLDEQHTLDPQQQEMLAKYATSDEDERTAKPLSPEILDFEGYGVTEQQFQLADDVPWYGLWAVLNQWKDISDLASVKEQHSYSVFERPYKFLQAADKRTADHDTRGATAAIRKQVPVFLDFNEGRVYIENSNKKMVQAIGLFLKQLGIEIIPVAWTYNRSGWPAAILNKLYEGTQFQSDFIRRADEATRFRPKEIEKLEDKELESIVANYFSMTQLPSELWAGISGSARIRLHQAGQPISVRAPTSATTLLHMTSDASLLSGSVTFEERITYLTKKGEERTFRKGILSLDINDQINLTEAGAAMLRGFDIPWFKKDIQREIRQTKQVPSIEQFWFSWLNDMNNAVRTIEASFREILDLDGSEPAGILPMRAGDAEEEEDLELANV